MKRIAALFLAILMLTTLAACSGGAKNETEPTSAADTEATGIVSTVPADNVDGEGDRRVILTDDMRKLFDKALDGLVGAEYEPIAYIPSDDGMQRVLSKMTLMVPDASPAYAIVVMNGDGELTEILHSEAEAAAGATGELAGGWEEADPPVISGEALEAFNKAVAPLDSVTFEPIALLAAQIVAGMNYSVLAWGTKAGDTEPRYAIVHIYADLNGGAELTETYSFMSVE